MLNTNTFIEKIVRDQEKHASKSRKLQSPNLPLNAISKEQNYSSSLDFKNKLGRAGDEVMEEKRKQMLKMLSEKKLRYQYKDPKQASFKKALAKKDEIIKKKDEIIYKLKNKIDKLRQFIESDSERFEKQIQKRQAIIKESEILKQINQNMKNSILNTEAVKRKNGELIKKIKEQEEKQKINDEMNDSVLICQDEFMDEIKAMENAVAEYAKAD